MFPALRETLTRLYLDDPRPWLIGFSGGKDSTLVAALIFETVLALPPEQRTKEISVVCTDTRVEIPAIAETIEDALEKMRQCSAAHDLKIDVNLLKPPAEQSFWLGRGYPAPNRLFRWCTQRLKIDPVTEFVTRRIGRWGEAILHLGARRSESATRAQVLASYEQRNGLRRHRDLPNVWVATPIEHLSTEEEVGNREAGGWASRGSVGSAAPAGKSVGWKQSPALPALRQRRRRRVPARGR